MKNTCCFDARTSNSLGGDGEVNKSAPGKLDPKNHLEIESLTVSRADWQCQCSQGHGIRENDYPRGIYRESTGNVTP